MVSIFYKKISASIFDMNISLIFSLFFFLQTKFVPIETTAESFEIPEVKTISIIPKPNDLKMQGGVFKINKNTTFILPIGAEDVELAVNYLIEKIEKSAGFRLNTSSSISEKNVIAIELSADIKNEEGYELNVTQNKIYVKSKSAAGIFYAMQSIRQMLPAAIEQNSIVPNLKLEVPCCEIKDEPRFSWRGLHLDVGRHFFEVDFIKKYIDKMAANKYNRFHWHLTEDQGWRIEIKKYPKLTFIGAQRKETLVGSHKNRPQRFDKKPYGGFYTQDQIREVVEYAKARFVTVVPEIEMPGHALAALAAYPEYSCAGKPLEVGTRWGSYDDVFCPKEETFQFLEDILSETIELFPSEYVHIGGDECSKIRWKTCQKCQKRIKDEGLKDEFELQSYFVKRIERFLNEKRKKLIGWDEILEGGLSDNATVMCWRGEKGGILAAQQRHDVIMSPEAYCYFNFYQQPDKAKEPLAMGKVNTLEHTYSYDPIPNGLVKEEEKFILGAQGNVWTEYIKTPEMVEYMTFPRAYALSEVLWTNKENKNWYDFKNRLVVFEKRIK